MSFLGLSWRTRNGCSQMRNSFVQMPYLTCSSCASFAPPGATVAQAPEAILTVNGAIAVKAVLKYIQKSYGLSIG